MTGTRVAFQSANRPMFGKMEDETPDHFATLADTRPPAYSAGSPPPPYSASPNRTARPVFGKWGATLTNVNLQLDGLSNQFAREAEAAKRALPASMRSKKVKASWQTWQGVRAELFGKLVEALNKDVNRKRGRFNNSIRKTILAKMAEDLQTSIKHYGAASIKTRGEMFRQTAPDESKLQEFAAFASFATEQAEQSNRRAAYSNRR